MNIQDFLNAVLKQDAEQLRTYFSDSAYINWHCTNEHFTVEEYIQANCEYPVSIEQVLFTWYRL